MNKTEEIVEERTYSVTERNKELHNEVSSHFLRCITNKNLKKKIAIADVMPQIITSCIIHSITIKAGINMAYSTVLLDGLEADDNMKITESEGSWIVIAVAHVI